MVSRVAHQLEQAGRFVNYAYVARGFENFETVVNSVSTVAGFVYEHPLRRASLLKNVENSFVSRA
jgi:hypothetical protein